jgi:hypothetical protein
MTPSSIPYGEERGFARASNEEAFARPSPFIQTFTNGTHCPGSRNFNRTAAVFLQCCSHRPVAAGKVALVVGVHEDRPCEYRVDVCVALACEDKETKRTTTTTKKKMKKKKM